MTGLKQRLRNPGLVLGILAVIISSVGASVAVGYAAGSSNTIKACVAKKSGNLYQAKKCKKGDKKLKWNIQGPQGATGATGAAGANGAVAGYSAVQSGSQNITANSSYTNILTEALPAGSYIADATALLAAAHSSGGQGASTSCQLTDGTNTDTSQVAGAMGAVFLFFTHAGTASLSLPVSSTGPVTLTLRCRNDLNAPPAGYSVSVSNAKISAVQTSANH
jgi:hypothetical protein